LKREENMENSPEELIDLRINPPKYPGKYRCLQVYQCRVCGWMTNGFNMDWAGLPSQDCPYLRKDWLYELERKVVHAKLPHPKSYAEELQKEIEAERSIHSKEITSDIVGNPDFSQKKNGLIAHQFLGSGEFIGKF